MHVLVAVEIRWRGTSQQHESRYLRLDLYAYLFHADFALVQRFTKSALPAHVQYRICTRAG